MTTGCGGESDALGDTADRLRRESELVRRAPAVITTLLEEPVEVRPVRVATSVYVPAAAVPVI